MGKILQKVKQQIILLFYAVSYFTRVPIPRCIVFDSEQFHKANAYLPLIGLGIGLIMGIVFYLSQLLFSHHISLILMLISSLLLTGALHEDGFADCCDGLGGGYNPAQRLKIMKDSQIGTYAGIGLIILFLLKFNLLLELTAINYSSLFVALLVAQSLSRYAALCIMQLLPYVRLDESSKVQSLATKLDGYYFAFASLCAAFSLLLIDLDNALIIIVSCGLVSIIIAKKLIKNLQGYTGDCLGFVQQFIELTILLLFTQLLTK